MIGLPRISNQRIVQVVVSTSLIVETKLLIFKNEIEMI